MEIILKQIGKRVVIISAILTFVLTIIIEIFYEKIVYTMPGYVLRTSQMIERKINILGMVIAVGVAIIISFMYRYFFCINKEM